MRVRVELEFDEKKLGPKWLNRDNLELLLYTEAKTRRDLLRIVKYVEEGSSRRKPNLVVAPGKQRPVPPAGRLAR